MVNGVSNEEVSEVSGQDNRRSLLCSSLQNCEVLSLKECAAVTIVKQYRESGDKTKTFNEWIQQLQTNSQLPKELGECLRSGLVTYSIFFCPLSQSRICVKKCVFNNRTIKVCVSCCWRCPGTSAQSAAHLTVSLYLCSSGSNARGESRAREGRRVSSKSPLRVWDGDEGVAGRNGRE